jgi:hypothetical protein
VQLGERPAAALPDDERACLAAYVDGLRAEGCDVDVAAVERGHALQMLLFGALPSLPFELLDAPPTLRRSRSPGSGRPRRGSSSTSSLPPTRATGHDGRTRARRRRVH